MPNANQVTVEVFPAGEGDSILLRCESGGRPFNILVDGGVRKTYQDHLRAKLLALRSAGERLDVLVVTHIDSDHIGGALSLLKANGPAATPAVIEIGDIWHNGYRHLRLQGRKPNDDEKRRVLAQVSGVAESAAQTGDISVREGDTLARLIVEGGYPWNAAWGGGPALAGGSVSLAPQFDVTLLSPGTENLETLAYHWRKGLLSMGVSYEAVDCPEFEDAFEKVTAVSDEDTVAPEGPISAYTGYDPPDPATFVEDTSKTNGSSIAFMLHSPGFRGVFLGDSWPSVIASEWEKLPPEVRASPVEVLKLAHHGSWHNASPALLQLIAARHYVVSTDGSKHTHPDLGTLLWAADRGRSGATLVFNYPSESAMRMSQPEATDRFGHKVILGDGTSPVRLAFTDEAARGSAEG